MVIGLRVFERTAPSGRHFVTAVRTGVTPRHGEWCLICQRCDRGSGNKRPYVLVLSIPGKRRVTPFRNEDQNCPLIRAPRPITAGLSQEEYLIGRGPSW